MCLRRGRTRVPEVPARARARVRGLPLGPLEHEEAAPSCPWRREETNRFDASACRRAPPRRRGGRRSTAAARAIVDAAAPSSRPRGRLADRTSPGVWDGSAFAFFFASGLASAAGLLATWAAGGSRATTCRRPSCSGTSRARARAPRGAAAGGAPPGLPSFDGAAPAEAASVYWTPCRRRGRRRRRRGVRRRSGMAGGRAARRWTDASCAPFRAGTCARTWSAISPRRVRVAGARLPRRPSGPPASGSRPRRRASASAAWPAATRAAEQRAGQRSRSARGTATGRALRRRARGGRRGSAPGCAAATGRRAAAAVRLGPAGRRGGGIRSPATWPRPDVDRRAWRPAASSRR